MWTNIKTIQVYKLVYGTQGFNAILKNRVKLNEIEIE